MRRRWSASLAGAVRPSSRGIAGHPRRGGGARALAIAVSPRLEFNSDPLHTKDPTTEAMRTLYDLMDDPVTNPYSISLIEPNVADSRSTEGEARSSCQPCRR